MNSMIDTHAHLDMDPFDGDREEVILRARETGVNTIVTVGIDPESCRKAVELAESYDGIYAALGVHPHFAGKFSEADIASLEQMAQNPRVVAVGETGMDLFRDYSPEEEQRILFRRHLEIADRVDKPIVIHCRQAEHEVIPILREWVSGKRGSEKSPGVIHCFNGNMDNALEYLDMGFYLAFGAYIGYPSSLELRNIVARVPADSLVVETDCPFLPPQARRGKRNEPAYMAQTVELIAKIRQVPVETVAAETTRNAVKLFGLKEAA